VVHPIAPPMRRSFDCAAMRRVVTRAHGYCHEEKEPPNNFEYGDEMDLIDGRVTACFPLMRALRGVMLNGLCDGVRVISVELDAGAIPDFVQCMRAGVIGSMRKLHVLFVQFTPPGVVDTALRSVTEGTPGCSALRRAPDARHSPPVPRLQPCEPRVPRHTCEGGGPPG
jgi:hypothetical protein